MKYLPTEQTRRSRISKALLSLLAVVGVFLLVIAGSVMFSRNRMNNTASTFMNAYIGQNAESAYTVTSRPFRDNTSKEELSEFFSENQIVEELTKANTVLTGGLGRSTRAEITYDTTGYTGSKMQVKIFLVNSTGDWEVDYVEIYPEVPTENQTTEFI